MPLPPDIEDLHRVACEKGEETYIDPGTGFTVFTKLGHLNRGKCCGFRCRHCPYEYANVAQEASTNPGSDPNGRTQCDVKEVDYDALHREAVEAGKQRYTDPKTGQHILTSLAHKLRGSCCGSGCRHCPYSSPADKKEENKSEKSKNNFRRKSTKRSKRRGIIYTRSGDKGKTALFTGQRWSKDSEIFEALGAVDELNANLGLVHAHCISDPKLKTVKEDLETIICWLLDVGSHIATPRNGVLLENYKKPTEEQLKRSSFDPNRTEKLETWMEEMLGQLPDITSFVLPTGSKVVSSLHVARTVCRRAERYVIPLVKAGTSEEQILKFMNRLSDFLFVLSRYAAMICGDQELTYVSVKSVSIRRLHRHDYKQPSQSASKPAQTPKEPISILLWTPKNRNQIISHIFVFVVAVFIGKYLVI
ncbi:hypothetical protein AAMO2058_000351800 [Amorphochlora amoebiformis]